MHCGLDPPFADEFRELALLAEGVRFFTEVADDLQEPLLRRGAFDFARRSAAQQTMARETEDRVVFGGRPGQIARFNFFLQARGIGVLSLDGAHPEPRENDVHGQIGYASWTNERLRGLEPLRSQG